jgi:hypothetical protein
MRRTPVYATVVLALIALGCNDQQHSLMDPTTDPPAFSVERGTAELGFIVDDGINIVFIGVTVEDLVSAFCTGIPVEVDQVNELVVTRPDGSTKQQLKGDANVVVMDLAAFEQFFCQDASAVPTYTGTARVVGNDSDADLSGPGADASQLHVVGTVTDASGQPYHLTVVNQGVVAPEFTSVEDFEFRHTNTKIHLKPIGG